jgi:hypothetical protein
VQQQQTPGSAAAAAAAGSDPVSAALAAAAGLTTPQQQQQQQQRESPGKAAADPQQQQLQRYASFPRVVQSPLPPLWNAQLPPPVLLPLPPVQPLAGPLLRVFGSAPPGQPYALAKALCDSGKLTALDQLLVRLKAEGHRVLVFCQVRLMLWPEWVNDDDDSRANCWGSNAESCLCSARWECTGLHMV